MFLKTLAGGIQDGVRETAMTKLDPRATANMGIALENVCRSLPNSGGDHETRKYVAKKLIQAARRGNTGLAALEDVARHALDDLSRSQAI